MSDLIDSLLTLSRLGRKEMSRRVIDTNLLVKGVLKEISKEQNKEVKIDIKELPKIEGDVELLKQVYINLISNAIKYSSKKEKPVVEIGAECKEEKTIFYVKDNGAGFNMEYEEKLFGVFQRLHGAREFEGIGIGLAIVKRIINSHGGRIWAHGKVNEGATFYFSLN